MLGEPVSLELPFRERHQAENALVALAVYAALGLPLDRAREGAAGSSSPASVARRSRSQTAAS